jgi:hypothetical protein
LRRSTRDAIRTRSIAVDRVMKIENASSDTGIGA